MSEPIAPLYPPNYENGEPSADPICPVTGSYCNGDFCDDYVCARAVGIDDSEEI